MEKKLQKLKQRLQEVADLNGASALLNWDQATYMPSGGAPARARQSALLSKLAQEKFIDPKMGKLIDKLVIETEKLPYEHDDAALLRVVKREYDRSTKIPPQFLMELYTHIGQAYHVWTTARPENDFQKVAPFLEKGIEYSRKLSDYLRQEEHQHVMDPLIESSDYGMNVTQVTKLFGDLQAELVPIVEAISRNPAPDDHFLYNFYPKQKQLDLGEKIAREYGYDFNRGRMDLTAHPFMTKFALGDVRITTRVDEQNFNDCLFSVLHEAGHAMYEQGINLSYAGTPLARGASSGVHESQSRLWENQVGRSRPFWEHYYPHLQSEFPEQLQNVDMEQFYRAINKSSCTLIRTDADEVTYNLHVIIRFGLEKALLEGSLAVADLPEAWHAAYEKNLGVRAEDDRDGVLQDVHWYGGLVGGAFQGYTIGNIMSALFFDQVLNANPNIMEEIGRGEFNHLLSWLQENIYQYGRKFTPNELVERVTGSELTIDAYIRYLKGKFGEIYELN